MALHYKFIGITLIILAFVHAFFPKYFKWKDELKHLSLINRQMMLVHTFFIALVLFLMGILCITAANELIETKLGKMITFGLGIFWATRLFFQFFIYSATLWKGKTFETIIHILFIILWSYLSVVFFYSALI